MLKKPIPAWAHYANDCHHTSKKCNAKLSSNPRQSKVTLKVKPQRPIQAGQEILASYGSGYWKEHNNKRTTRKEPSARAKRAKARKKN